MKVTCQKVGSVEVLQPEGPLTEETLPDFRVAAQRPLAAPHPRMVVSMGSVPFMDSRALEMLVDCAAQLRERNLSLKLAGLPPTCREILYLTDLQAQFELFDEVTDAVKSYL